MAARATKALAVMAAGMMFAGVTLAGDVDVAFIGELSGARASLAQDQLDGFRLGLRHLGGRLGGVEINFSVTDDQRNAEIARQAAETALQSNRLKILILSSAAPLTQAMVAEAAGKKVVVLNLGMTGADLAGHDCQPHFFSLVPRPELFQEMAGLYLQGQGFKRVAVVVSGTHKDALAGFRRAFKGEVSEIAVKPGSMEFSPALNAIKAASADAVYLLLSGGMAVDFLQQYSAAGLKQQFPLFASGDLFDHTVLAAAAPAPVNMFSVGIWSEDLDSPANKRLEADFEIEFGRPVSGRAAAGYDAAMVLDATIRSVDRKLADIELVRAAMKRVDFPSTRGYFRFDNDQFPILNFWVRQVVADQRGRMISEQRGMLQGAVHDPLARECPMRAAPEPAPKK